MEEQNAVMQENVRVMITISPYDYRKLRQWAIVHGKPPSAFAAQIVASRLEANLDVIQQQMEEIAEFEGISLKELESKWDKDSE
ncbi:MAG: hypothetical protein SVX43_03695 [Cyanobacteriota bacterium]|nr:hypothetical protein [Cyanobacteriota bacterium]